MGDGVTVDRNASRVVASILQSTQPREQKLQDGFPVSSDLVIVVPEDTAHTVWTLQCWPVSHQLRFS